MANSQQYGPSLKEEVFSKIFGLKRKKCRFCKRIFYCKEHCSHLVLLETCICGYCDTAGVGWQRKCKKEGDFETRIGEEKKC